MYLVSVINNRLDKLSIRKVRRRDKDGKDGD